jgi:hypothetical protein
VKNSFQPPCIERRAGVQVRSLMQQRVCVDISVGSELELVMLAAVDINSNIQPPLLHDDRTHNRESDWREGRGREVTHKQHNKNKNKQKHKIQVRKATVRLQALEFAVALSLVWNFTQRSCLYYFPRSFVPRLTVDLAICLPSFLPSFSLSLALSCVDC